MNKLRILIFQCLLVLLTPIAGWGQSFQAAWSLNGLSEEIITEIQVDKSGNQYIAGFFGNTIHFPNQTITSQGFRDAFIAKVDSDGNMLWYQILATELNDEIQHLGIDTAGNSYLFLEQNDSLQFQGQTYFSASFVALIKLDPAGNLVWHRNPFQGAVPTFTDVYDMAVNATGALVLTGGFGFTNDNFQTELVFDLDTLETTSRENGQYTRQMWVARYEPYGQFVWARASQATGILGANGLHLAIQDDGNCLVGGSFSPDIDRNQDISFGHTVDSLACGDIESFFAVEYDPAGTPIWVNSIQALFPDGGFNAQVQYQSMHWASDKSLYVGGFFSGQMVWQSDTIATGFDPVIPPADVFIGRISRGQAQGWLKRIPTSQFGRGDLSVLASDTLGHVYAGGIFRDSIWVANEWHTGIAPELWVSQWDTLGHAYWALTAEESGFEMQFNSMVSTRSGRLYVAGGTDVPTQFGDILLDEPEQTSCCMNTFLAIVDSLPLTHVSPPLSNWSGKIYPNPSQGLVHIRTTDTKMKGLKLYDMQGRELTCSSQGNAHQQSLQTPFKGMALLIIETQEGFWREKVWFQ